MVSMGFPVLPLVISMLGSASTAFWILQIIKCYTQEPEGVLRTFWLLFIAFTNVIGAIAYLLYSEYRKRRSVDFK